MAMAPALQKPFLLTIFGASGDLAKLKLFPAIYALAERKLLPENFLIVGFARSKLTTEELRKDFLLSLVEAGAKKIVRKTVDQLLKRVFYFSGDYQEEKDFRKYQEFLKHLRTKLHISSGNLPHLAYFSVPPFLFQPILENLALTRNNAQEDIRIVLEKPFGNDERSAQELFHSISRRYSENQIYLLDHYLGKGAVQSILALRHANAVLNLLLKGREIASIQITAIEDIGVENRVGYFDAVGIIKDMFQSHLTQLLAMITMSIPLTETAESFQREKYAILSALKFSPSKENIFLGQYASYQKLPDVGRNSKTETFMAVKVKIDRESWYGVPIFVRTGKKLAHRATNIVIEFAKTPFQRDLEPNRLIFELAPEERLHFRLVNTRGDTMTPQELAPTGSISCDGTSCLPEHATLLLDVLKKRKLHFLSFAEIIAAWRITDSILNFIKRSGITPEIYADGTALPEGAKKIFRKPGEKWFEL